MRQRLLYLFIILSVLVGCNTNKQKKGNSLFTHISNAKDKNTHYDLNQILDAGELIIGTISGPTTYFDYNGQGLGMQYALAQNFAQSQGVRLRVELAKNEQQLVQLLKNKDIDIAVYQLSKSFIQRQQLTSAGAQEEKVSTSWAVNKSSEDLAQALNDWYSAGVALKIQKEEIKRFETRNTVIRKMRAPYLSREKGIISVYDYEFRAASAVTGWDWRLIAAQCYQESGFDPNATSYAGAKGLMQIMPRTAIHLGVSNVNDPKENVAAAARYIRELSGKFSGIRDSGERIKFILAAYNGGVGHIQDAQALARKYGKNPHLWDDVSFYVRNLTQPLYYRDPVVSYGYMIGSETYGYVDAILSRWRAYGGNPGAGTMAGYSDYAVSGNKPRKSNRFTKGTKIYGPDDPEFNGLKE